ncbi:RING-H2 finger protein ATL43-like [Olea europaea var. sylvestris]|uniref:RING-H2 finger protein ATL43-like n=1 Tax=Olea europaea var. sylvestris TaxID=158386 RepID=UPI000C1D4DA2|nr:RING-H2 finger protein ATL43-like [Olea europaea var. sylvestris]
MDRLNFLLFFFTLILPIFDYYSSSTLALVTPDDENGNNIGKNTRLTNPPPPSQPPPPLPPSSESRAPPFSPGVAAIVGVLTTIFSIIFLLLLYVKHCKRRMHVNNSRGYPQSAMAARKNSGIDQKVIASLPIFRFESLRGQKDGLECAVCLNRFEHAEFLRLLPKCKHAFHVECVDTWLDAHSTCPLCRYQVDPEDILLVDYENKSLYNHDQSNEKSSCALLSPTQKGKKFVNPKDSGRHSSAGERGKSLEIVLENPGKDSGRRSLDSWKTGSKNGFRKDGAAEKSRQELGSKSVDSSKSRRTLGNESRKDRQLLEQQKQVEKHRLDHRIIISRETPEISSNHHHDHRWSDVLPTDLLYLRSEMILGESLWFSGQWRSVGDENDRAKGSGGVMKARSVSEITGMSRYRSNGRQEEGQRHEGVVKRWLAWISQSQQQKMTTAQAARPSFSSSSSTSIVV